MKNEELFREIKKSIAVIIPSEWYENNPMAVIEAFALGKPVIGSRIAGIPELVKDDYTGLTFQTKNAFDLYLKMKFVLENPDKTKLMGQNARYFVLQELNSEKYYEKLIRIYEQVMQKHHAL